MYNVIQLKNYHVVCKTIPYNLLFHFCCIYELLGLWSLSESVSGLDQLEHTSQQKPNSIESDSHQDGKVMGLQN